jgi:hypothetical protein
MERPKITGYDCLTGEHIDREMNDEEFAQYEANLANPVAVPDAG